MYTLIAFYFKNGHLIPFALCFDTKWACWNNLVVRQRHATIHHIMVLLENSVVFNWAKAAEAPAPPKEAPKTEPKAKKSTKKSQPKAAPVEEIPQPEDNYVEEEFPF